MKIKKMIGRGILVFLIVSMVIVWGNGQTEEVIPEVETELDQPQELAEPVELATRLDVTIIDGINDKLVKLKNCMVYVRGKLHIAEDAFDYTNTFMDGDRYEITIQIRLKK